MERINTPYELFILLLSFLSVGNIFFFIFPGFTGSAEGIVHIFDGMLSIIFIADFSVRIIRADSRFTYLVRKFGWADLLGSLPFPGLRIFRIFRIIRAITVLKRMGPEAVSQAFSEKRAESAILLVIFLVILIIEIGSTLILQVEQYAPGSNIRTASDALWWAYVTIATVGYGDCYPVTDIGRLIGVCLMTCGVSIFATLAGFISNRLLTPKSEHSSQEIQELQIQLTKQQEMITELLQKIDFVQKPR